VQEEDLAGMGLQELIENYGTATEMTGGPFDKVNKMIKGLISSLKAEANEEVNQHQFCQDSLSKNRNDKVAKKNSIDTLASSIRWSQMAIVRLDDDVQYMNKEMKRLTDLMGTEAKELAGEKKRIAKELKEHTLANEVVAKAVVILTQVCNLKSAAASFIQASGSRGGSRMDQCKEAAKLLKDGLKGLKKLDTQTNSYLKSYTDLSTGINADAKKAKDARDSELKSTQAARAQRASELATAVKDKKEAEKELKLIDDAKKELEQQCSHVETREEKMARRKDEIDALKEALNVLEGEAIPV
jgi:chromosome segregation ATPase